MLSDIFKIKAFDTTENFLSPTEQFKIFSCSKICLYIGEEWRRPKVPFLNDVTSGRRWGLRILWCKYIKAFQMADSGGLKKLLASFMDDWSMPWDVTTFSSLVAFYLINRESRVFQPFLTRGTRASQNLSRGTLPCNNYI